MSGFLLPSIKEDKYSYFTRNSILSNTAYKGYKYREKFVRSFQVLPLSDIYFLVSISQVAQYIVALLPIVANIAD